MEATVIHPRFTLYGGGEVVGLHVCKVLQQMGYRVHLACDNFNPAEADRHLGLGNVMKECTHVPIVGEFKPGLAGTLLAYQRALHFIKLSNSVKIPENSEFVFSTQTMVYFKPDLLNFCMAYDLADSLFSWQIPPNVKRRVAKQLYDYPLERLYQHYAGLMRKKRNFFISLSHSIEESMVKYHYPHSSSVFPPCEMSLRPMPKERYCINTSRIVPSKRLDDFIEIARRMPHYKFVVVGKMSKIEESLFPGYKEKILASLPANAILVEGIVRENRELVERAKVYLYPSVELGVSVSLGQAMGAGCIPVTPNAGGGAEMVDASGTGYKYDSLNQAVTVLKGALESEAERDSPKYIATQARIFSAESFEENIRKIVSEKIA